MNTQNKTKSQIVPDDLNDRRGRFQISHDAIRDHPDLVLQMLEGVIPIHVESRYDLGALKYIAIGAQFRYVKMGDAVPHYVGEFVTLTDNDGEQESIFKGWSECN